MLRKPKVKCARIEFLQCDKAYMRARRDEISEEKKIRSFLEAYNFDFGLVRSKTYCRQFFSQLESQKKKLLLEYLCNFARQPFIKMKKVAPDLLAKVFSSSCVYLYWVSD